MKSVLAAVSVATVLAGASAACADTVLTFEGHTNTIYSAPIVRSGFQIRNPVGDIQHFHEINSTLFGLPNNGTGVLLVDRVSTIEITKDGGGDFSLKSFDAALWLTAGSMTVEAFSAGNMVASFNTGAITPQVWSSYNALAGFGDVDKLIFSSDNAITNGSTGWVLDNVHLGEATLIPLPTGAGLALAGLGMVAIRRRRA